MSGILRARMSDWKSISKPSLEIVSNEVIGEDFDHEYGPILGKEHYDAETDKVEETPTLSGLESRTNTLTRFQQLRSALTFTTVEVTRAESAEDPLVRIRSLINLLKLNAAKYVNPGRELSLDEASVACGPSSHDSLSCVQ